MNRMIFEVCISSSNVLFNSVQIIRDTVELLTTLCVSCNVREILCFATFNKLVIKIA